MSSGQSTRPTELVRALAVSLVTLAVIGSAGAEGLDWTDPEGGLFHDPANWDPPLVPGPKDTVFFRMGHAYTVDFAGDATTRWLRVYAGEVTFDLAAHTYDLDGGSPEIVITSQPAIGPSARLIVRDGTLRAAPEIAITSDGSGSLELAGAGASLSSGGRCIVGLLGAGDMTVSAGAQGLIATDLILGDLAGSSGALLVTGEGSRLATRDRHIWVGREGAGSALVCDGGTLVSGRSSVVGMNGVGPNTALVTGAGSRWDSEFGFTIGQDGIGEMRVEQGGAASSLHVTGLGTQGGEGTLIVTGAGSCWDVLDSAFVIGIAGGTGRLAVLNGATASSRLGVSMGEIGAGFGEIVVSGAGSRLEVGDRMVIGHSPDSTGIIEISDGGRLELDGFAEVGRAGRGVLEISGGGTCTISDQAFLGSQPSQEGSLTLVDGADSLLTVGDALEIGSNASAQVFVTGGRIEVGGSSVAGVNATGAASIGLLGAGSSWTTEGELLIGGGGPAVVTVANDAVLAAAPVVVGGPGVLQGDGVVIGAVENRGAVGLGVVIGRLTVEGSFTQTSAGALLVDLAPGERHDRLVVCGDAALDGAVRVTRLQGYEPEPGAQFEIVRTVDGSVTGAFASVEADGRFDVHYEPDHALLVFLGEFITGDVNVDGFVDFDDLLLLLAAWGACPEPPDPCPADIDEDGTVGFPDLLVLLANWT